MNTETIPVQVVGMNVEHDGRQPDIIDFAFTVAGVAVGYALRLGIITLAG